MKAIPTTIGYKIEKGKTVIDIIPGRDRPYVPVKIKFEGQFYPLKVGLIKVIKEFENCYSEEQVLETLIKLTTE